MPIRVYECARGEVEALKKALEYDPYTDPTLLPPRKYDEKDVKKLSKEEQELAKKEDAERAEILKRMREDRLLNIIFYKQDCRLRDAQSIGSSGDRSFLYISAPDDFLNGAEEKFRRDFKTVKRASKEDEERFISTVNKEEETANAGFGSIFGS